MAIVQAANLALRFLLELCALAALAYWGFHTGEGTLARIALGIGAALLAAVIWGTFVAPNAAVAVGSPVRLALELLVFGAAVAGLLTAGRPSLGIALGVVYIINRVLMAIWGQ
ncbi:MAG: YrdB family protein [Sphaerobacter sp.]|nr:YrdB family protein [Sphaerobacter sp.]